MITYSTNWMGPVSLKWYEDRNLTTTKTIMVKDQLVETVDITQRWSGGRIDVSNGDELGLPIMRDDCYRRFSEWLYGVCTEKVWTLDKLVESYEKTNPKIIWAKDVFGVEE